MKFGSKPEMPRKDEPKDYGKDLVIDWKLYAPDEECELSYGN